MPVAVAAFTLSWWQDIRLDVRSLVISHILCISDSILALSALLVCFTTFRIRFSSCFRDGIIHVPGYNLLLYYILHSTYSQPDLCKPFKGDQKKNHPFTLYNFVILDTLVKEVSVSVSWLRTQDIRLQNTES